MSLCQLRVGLERGFEGRSLAWALDFPGAFSYGQTDLDAIGKLPEVLNNYYQWLKEHGKTIWDAQPEFSVCIEESFDTIIIDGDPTIHAFFEDDRPPLNSLEIENGMQIHRWQRQELLAGVKHLRPELMTRLLPGQRWNINGVLNHIGRTEIHYLQNLNLPLPGTEIPIHNPFKILELAYSLVQGALPSLAGDTSVLEKEGELWSARKLMRFLLWHQRDHIEHIQQIIQMANE